MLLLDHILIIVIVKFNKKIFCLCHDISRIQEKIHQIPLLFQLYFSDIKL